MRYSLKSLGYFAVFLSLVFANAPKKQYSAKGGDAVLNPHYKGSTITSMEWKHGSDLAAEWYGEDPACLHNFKGRCKLNTSTGALTITGLDGSENGIFSVAINDKQIDTKISLVVISKVPKPTISSDCDTTHCTLTCAGNTTDAEPVDCTWFTGDAETGSGMELEITKETKEESFTCMLQNPVSSERSESLPNPIMMKDQRNRMISIIVPIVVILVLVALIVLIAFVVIRKRNGRSFDLNWFRERAARGTKEANNVMLLNGEAVLPQPNVTVEAPVLAEASKQGTGETPNQDLSVPESLNICNETKRLLNSEAVLHQPNDTLASEVQEESNQSSASGVIQNGVGGSDSDSQRVSTQVQVHIEPQNDGNSSEEVPLMAETSKQDPESAESPDTREETGNTPGTDKTPNQDLTVPEPLNTSEETENSAVTSNNHEVTNHKSTNQESTNPKPALVEEEVDGGGDGD